MRCDVWLVLNQDKQNTYTEGGTSSTRLYVDEGTSSTGLLKKEPLQHVYRRRNIFNTSI